MDRVRELLQKKICEANSQEDLQKIEIIRQLVQKDDCFLNLDLETAIGILEFLGVGESEIVSFYQELISPKNYSNQVSKERILVEELPTKNL
jgi:hypothetical protein